MLYVCTYGCVYGCSTVVRFSPRHFWGRPNLYGPSPTSPSRCLSYPQGDSLCWPRPSPRTRLVGRRHRPNAWFAIQAALVTSCKARPGMLINTFLKCQSFLLMSTRHSRASVRRCLCRPDVSDQSPGHAQLSEPGLQGYFKLTWRQDAAALASNPPYRSCWYIEFSCVGTPSH